MLKSMFSRAKFVIVPALGYQVICLLGRTMRMRVEGVQSVDRLLAQGQRMIIAFWHAQQFMMPLAYRGTGAACADQSARRWRAHPTHCRSVRVAGCARIQYQGRSRSLAGTHQARTIRCRPGDHPGRSQGASSSGENGRGAAGQSDGVADRPPRLRLLKKKLFASWDRFIMPYPFSSGIFLWGEPIHVSREAAASELEHKRVELENDPQPDDQRSGSCRPSRSA